NIDPISLSVRQLPQPALSRRCFPGTMAKFGSCSRDTTDRRSRCRYFYGCLAFQYQSSFCSSSSHIEEKKMQPSALDTSDAKIMVADNASQSAVSWPAIFAGGVAAFAIAFILLALGTGIGLSSISP